MACGDVPRCGCCGGYVYDRWHQCYQYVSLVPDYGIALSMADVTRSIDVEWSEMFPEDRDMKAMG